MFPLTLGQILRQYAITELHLTLNAGKWNYDDWGHPPEASVGTGAELWAWMGASEVTTCVSSMGSYDHVHSLPRFDLTELMNDGLVFETHFQDSFALPLAR